MSWKLYDLARGSMLSGRVNSYLILSVFSQLNLFPWSATPDGGV